MSSPSPSDGDVIEMENFSDFTSSDESDDVLRVDESTEIIFKKSKGSGAASSNPPKSNGELYFSAAKGIQIPPPPPFVVTVPEKKSYAARCLSTGKVILATRSPASKDGTTSFIRRMRQIHEMQILSDISSSDESDYVLRANESTEINFKKSKGSAASSYSKSNNCELYCTAAKSIRIPPLPPFLVVTVPEKKSSAARCFSTGKVTTRSPAASKDKTAIRRMRRIHSSRSPPPLPVSPPVLKKQKSEDGGVTAAAAAATATQDTEQPRVVVFRRARQVYRHKYGPAVLAMGEKGYTLTNGIFSCCEDDNERWRERLAYDLNNAFKGVRRLFVVGDASYAKWITFLKGLKEPTKTRLKRLRGEVLAAKPTAPCVFCLEPACHRWKAIVAGIRRIAKFPVDTICH